MFRKSSRKTSQAEVKTLPSVPYFKLFRYASKCDKTLIFLGLTSSCVAALMVPMAINLSANIFKDLIEYQKSVLEKGKNIQSDEALSERLNEFSVKYISVAVVLLVGGYLGAALMNTTAINQIFRIRKEYLTAALNQDLSYFDTQQTGEFASKTSQDLLKLEEGINEKLSSMVYLLTTALSCVSLALVKGWKLALIYLSSTPISLLLVGIVGLLASKQAKKEAAASSKASGAAEETLSAIRTVYSYNGQEKEIKRYEKYVKEARKIDIRKECLQGLTISLLHLVVFCTYGVGFYIGVYLVVHDPRNYNAGVMFEVFFGVITGMMNLGMISTLVVAFGTARGSGTEVFALLDKVPTINPLLDRGLRPAAVQGDIVFQDVDFQYPSRPEVPVLRGLNLVVPSGQSVALVGPSGSGKSTVVQLICRFYDVVAGKVLLDGADVRSLSVVWLRAQVGLVGQEPVLFAGSVRDNIRHGRRAASDADVEAAARDAFAHSFIIKLPKGYDTLVGQRGTTISGGQKQRIAIARALVRRPRLLLLDEATSALDAASENIVQLALDRVSKGRTTLTVAHRLSTIRNADNIYVLDKGTVAEKGSHKELMQLRGLYYRMAKMQGVPDEYHEVERKSTEIDAMEDQVKPEKVESVHEAPEPPVSLARLVRLNAPEWRCLVLGSLCSVLLGFALPIYTIAFGKLFGAIAGTDTEQTMRSVVAVALVFVAMGVLFAVFNIIESASFGIAGAHLTERLRVMMFRHLLLQDVQYFDEESNSTGALCARLASETARIRQGTGQRIGSVLQGLGAVSIGIVLTFVNVWQAGLLALCFVPFVVIIIYFQIKAAKTESFGQAKALERSTKIAIEAITNVRTVASLGREKQVVQEYVEQLRPAVGPAKRMAHFIGAVNGLSKALSVLASAVVLPFAARLMITDKAKVENIVTCTQALQLSLMSVQNAFAHFPEFQKAILAGSRVLALLKTTPSIVDPVFPAVALFECHGEASLNNVDFRYPTRPNNLLLNGFNLKVEKDKTIALVGESGCGKSTVMNLLQRFYDPEAGSIKLDEYNVRELMVCDVRSSVAVVAQEPVLFARSLRDNIAYAEPGAPADRDVERAARQADIHAFIQSLPEGYDTNAGSKGVQLSGGQKQRIAIARALLKKPKILLLDEATSALDAESEKAVQEALSRARAGRSCVLVAHRASAVRDADVICLLEGGRVIEAGSHQQLLAAGGKYSQLHAQGT